MTLTTEQLTLMGKGLEQSEALYGGAACTTNAPFAVDEGYAVYVPHGATVVKVSFTSFDQYTNDRRLYVNTREDEPSNPLTPLYWLKRATECSFTDETYSSFSDLLSMDLTKKITSIRDGVQTYLGSEVGMVPADKAFTFYRSPETVAEAGAAMLGCGIVDGHIDLDRYPESHEIIGQVVMSEIKETIDPDYDSTLSVANEINATPELILAAEQGKRYFSLGYKAKVIPHPGEYDFEQQHIIVKHLGLVDSPRGGKTLTFNDRGGNVLKPFQDENGEMNIQRVAEIVQALPEVIKQMPLEKVVELGPILEEMMESVRASTASGEGSAEGEETPTTEEPKEELPATDEEGEGEEKPMEDENPEEDKEAKKPSFSDEDVSNAVNKGIQEHAKIVEAARPLLAENYSFADKTGVVIMRDALKRHTTETFTDAELPTAFKMIPKDSKYKDFGDESKEDVFEKDLY